MKIYVASSWRNTQQPEVVNSLRDSGHEVYDFRSPNGIPSVFRWIDISPNYEIWTDEKYLEMLQHPVAIEGFNLDWNAMQDADACVMVLPCGRSAHIEAGYFVGAGKKLFILMGGEIVPELMYKMADSIFTDLDSLVDFLVFE